MSVRKLPAVALIAFCALFCLCSGCVERKITIITEPPDALVALNDEEIGTSPVTVGFEWYGDFAVRITKDGYQTLNTHQNLKRPLKDVAPFDLLADMFTTKIDAYTWRFKLEPSVPVQKEDLIKSATALQKDATAEPNKPAPKKSKVKTPKPPKPAKENKTK